MLGSLAVRLVLSARTCFVVNLKWFDYRYSALASQRTILNDGSPSQANLLAQNHKKPPLSGRFLTCKSFEFTSGTALVLHEDGDTQSLFNPRSHNFQHLDNYTLNFYRHKHHQYG